MPINAVTVFCPSRVTEQDEEWDIAYRIGNQLGKLGITVLTGGRTGAMTAVTKGVKEAGGRTTGVVRNSDSKRNKYLSDEDILTIDPENTMPYRRSYGGRLTELEEQGEAYIGIYSPRAGLGTNLELAFAFDANISVQKSDQRPIALLHPGKIYDNVLFDLRGLFGGSYNTQQEYIFSQFLRNYAPWLRICGSELDPVKAAIKHITTWTP